MELSLAIVSPNDPRLPDVLRVANVKKVLDIGAYSQWKEDPDKKRLRIKTFSGGALVASKQFFLDNLIKYP